MSATDLRATLREHLRERLVARDKTAVQVIRTALAAIENAEAEPDDDLTQTERLFAASTSSDVARRVVSDEDARALVAQEIDDLTTAAGQYRSIGETDAAATVEHQAAILRQILSPEA